MASVIFFFTGRIFLPHLGVQNDEALFACAIYKPRCELYFVQIGHSKLPVMLMSYLGTLKAWIYRPIFQWFGAGISALRDPVLLAGVATIWLFYLLLRRAAGERAAVIGCALLTVDSLYLLTMCFDWGPVALQHLLLIAAMLLLLRFYQQPGYGTLAGGSFLLGLALWDKALALWFLGGIGIAGMLTFPRQIFAVTRWRRVLTAVLAFALGALPLMVYNVNNDWATFRNNVVYDFHGVAAKARFLASTADSSALFGWLVNEDWQTHAPHQPTGIIQNASSRISAIARHPRQNLTLYAFVLALLLAPLARGNARRAIVFALVAMTVCWFQMAITVNAGGSVHHAILLWPLPQMVIAISLAEAAKRLGRFGPRAVAALTALLVISGLLVTNEYYALMIRNGGGQNWTDAISPLAENIKRVPASMVYSMDWGIMDSLRLLGRGKLPLEIGFDQVGKPAMTEQDREIVMRMIDSPDHIFIAHTPDFQFFKGYSERLIEFAAGAGYERRMIAAIPDSFGRPVFEVYRFVRRTEAMRRTPAPGPSSASFLERRRQPALAFLGGFFLILLD